MQFYCKPNQILFQNRKRKNQFQKEIENGRGRRFGPVAETGPARLAPLPEAVQRAASSRW
jgi:hypothetical protein